MNKQNEKNNLEVLEVRHLEDEIFLNYEGPDFVLPLE